MPDRRKEPTNDPARGSQRAQPQVTAITLLKGAWYALEQAGRLLQAAAILYNEGLYSSALVMILFSREEVGKHRILKDLWRKAKRARTPLPVEKVRAVCRDHVAKQMSARVTVLKQMQGAKGPKGPTLPDDPRLRHGARKRFLYTELFNSGADWYRPSALVGRECWLDILHADLDYGIASGTEDIPSHRDVEFQTAIEAWKERPELPSLTAAQRLRIDMEVRLSQMTGPNAEQDPPTEEGLQEDQDPASDVRFLNLLEDIYRVVSARVEVDRSEPPQVVNALGEVLAWTIWNGWNSDEARDQYAEWVSVVLQASFKAYRLGRRSPDRPGGPVVFP